MYKRKVLLWCHGIDAVLEGSDNVAGIPVLMGLWGKMLVKKGFSVYSFTNDACFKQKGDISFVPLTFPRLLLKTKVLVFAEFFIYNKIIRKFKPDFVIIHASTRALFFLSVICKLHKIRLCYLGACDNDFIPGKEFLNNRIDKYLFRRGLKNVNYIFTQNKFQQNQMTEVYHKKSIVVPNIGEPCDENVCVPKIFDFIWVANIKPLKRLDWFVRMAEMLPNNSFAVVGGVQDYNYFEPIKEDITKLNNITYMGALSFAETSSLILQSKCLVCTSEFEGFPNTFIQAFSRGIPVISTVDPSDVISDNKIGYFVSSIDSLALKGQEIIRSQEKYDDMSGKALKYFKGNHSFESVYMLIKDYFEK